MFGNLLTSALLLFVGYKVGKAVGEGQLDIEAFEDIFSLQK